MISPPFRAEHIGSLVRPPELLRARQQHAASTLDRENLAAIENVAIARVVKLQEELGDRGGAAGLGQRVTVNAARV
jgi:methionine synthase II (cobalamin-independent)